MTALPAWERPLRIGDTVEPTHADPETALAGEVSCWHLPMTVCRDIPAGADVSIQLFGGRHNRIELPEVQVDRPDAVGYVAAEFNGHCLPLTAGDTPGTVHTTAPAGGIGKGQTVTVTLGANEKGLTMASIAQPNKFFLLSMIDDTAEAPPEWTHDVKSDIPIAACLMHILGNDIDHLRAYAPSQASTGTPVEILVRPEDRYCNLSHQRIDRFEVYCDDTRLDATVEPVDACTCTRLTVALPEAGVVRLRVVDPERGMEVLTNPIRCSEHGSETNVYWGMIHGHTEMSDGTGSLDAYFHQIRDQAGLDFAAPGDHDHLWETTDAMWRMTCDAVRRWNEPGRFVVFLGYEWAKWRRNGDGDRNVYYLGDDRPMYRSDEGYCATPPEMFRAIADEDAIVIPHHTGHYGNFCDFKDHDPVHERLIEIYQTRGSYETTVENGNVIPEQCFEPVVREGLIDRALAMGWRVGFTAGGDDHYAHAGTEYPFEGMDTQTTAGIMAVLAAERTRESIWEALWNRRVIATSAPRMLLIYTLNGQPMGSELSADEVGDRRDIHVAFHGTDDIDHIDIIRNNEVICTRQADGRDLEFTFTDTDNLADVALPPATYCGHAFTFYYVRAIQKDRHTAWASPIWID